MKKFALVILPLLFTAQSCGLFPEGVLFGGDDEGSGSMGVFISNDSGDTWEESNTISENESLRGSRVFDIYIQQDNTDNVLVATRNNGIFASDTAGEQWAPLLPNILTYTVFINPANEQEIYVGGARNNQAIILRSPNRGGVWNELFFEPNVVAAVTTLVPDPARSHALYAGLGTGTVLRSTDSGEHWTSLTDFSDRILRIVVSRSGVIYALTQSKGIFVSTNQGDTWRQSVIQSEGRGNSALQYSDFSYDALTGALYLATNKGLYRSENQGNSWQELSLPATQEARNVATVTVHPDDSRMLFASIGTTIYRSSDRGATWKTISLPPTRVIDIITIDPANPNRIYAGLR